MVKINIKKNNDLVYEIVIKGHSGYNERGKDIVCAAISTMAITSVNNILTLDDSISYEVNSGFLKIRVLKDTDINQKLLNNLIKMFKELKDQYPKNIEIRNED